MATDPQQTPSASATEAVAEELLKGILGGKWGPGTRLPAERELAKLLGASRATLRDALRRLTEWRLVEPRRGSGVVVLDRRDWSIEVLPAYLRYHRPKPGDPSVVTMLGDLLALRRWVLVGAVGMVAGRVAPGGLVGARAALERSWAARNDPATFAIEDFNLMRAIVADAGMLTAGWLLNRVASIYLEIARAMAGGMPPPDDYRQTWLTLLELLEVGDGQTAAAHLDDYLARHDARLMEALEAFS